MKTYEIQPTNGRKSFYGKSKYDLLKLGSNSGVYGWNWSAYLDPETNTLYISCYRNVPAYIREK